MGQSLFLYQPPEKEHRSWAYKQAKTVSCASGISGPDLQVRVTIHAFARAPGRVLLRQRPHSSPAPELRHPINGYFVNNNLESTQRKFLFS